MAIDTPSAFSRLRVARVTSVYCMAVLSVISSCSRRAGDRVHELGIVELARRQVHRNRQPALHPDEGGPAAGLAQHPFAELEDHAALLGELDEIARLDQAALGVLPPRERLVSGDEPGFRIDDRLVIDAQLVL